MGVRAHEAAAGTSAFDLDERDTDLGSHGATGVERWATAIARLSRL